MGKDDVIEINLGELFAVLLGKAWLIISSGVFFALLCLFISKFVLTPLYSSTTKIYILNKEEGATVTYSDVQISTQLTQDYAQLIKSRYVLEEVIQTLHLDMDYDEFSDYVSIGTPDDTRIVAITVRDSDPMMAMKEANCVREVASKHIQNVMDIDAINIAELANMPTEKYSPSAKRWGMIGGLAAVLVVSAIIILGYLMDDTIKSSDDIEAYLGLSTLAMIPAITEDQNSKKRKKKS
ncbi:MULTISPECIES: YveK family protein [unclassified Butyrivibrio]|uniref:YveK family protein n=1 Tax=unclassified Butyrivibrio TaxID=2639466 RepID=UPI0003F633F9|nr:MULTISPECIES: Wzz/FepE/Etk N-terminal domain-containing protein [unclassified Butyrivibrio]